MRQINDINNAPKSAMEQARIDKEKLNTKQVVNEPLSRCKCGLELAGKQPARWGKHNPNFNKHNIS